MDPNGYYQQPQGGYPPHQQQQQQGGYAQPQQGGYPPQQQQQQGGYPPQQQQGGGYAQPQQGGYPPHQHQQPPQQQGYGGGDHQQGGGMFGGRGGGGNHGPNVSCYNCGGTGHMSRQCPQPKPAHIQARQQGGGGMYGGGGRGGYQQQQGGYQQQGYGQQQGGYGRGAGGRGYGNQMGGGGMRGGRGGGRGFMEEREERKINIVVVPVDSVDTLAGIVAETSMFHADQKHADEYVTGPFQKGIAVTLFFTVNRSIVGKAVVASTARAKTNAPPALAETIAKLPVDWHEMIFKVKDLLIFRAKVQKVLGDLRLPGVHTMAPAGHGIEGFYPLHVVADSNMSSVLKAIDAPELTEEETTPDFSSLSVDDALKKCQENLHFLATICSACFSPETYFPEKAEGEVSRPTPEWRGSFLQAALHSFNQSAIDDKNLAVSAEGSFHTALILYTCFWGSDSDGHAGLVYYLQRELDNYNAPQPEGSPKPFCPVLTQFYGHPLLALSCVYRSITSEPEDPKPNGILRQMLLENFEAAAERCFSAYTCGRMILALLIDVVGVPKDDDNKISVSREKRSRDGEDEDAAPPAYNEKGEMGLIKATGPVRTTPPATPPSAGQLQALQHMLPVVAKDRILQLGWKHMQTSRMVQQILPCIMDIIVRGIQGLEEAACDIVRHLCLERLLDVSMDPHGNYLTTAVFENLACRMDLNTDRDSTGNPPAFTQVLTMLLEKVAGSVGQQMACSKTASNCLDNMLKGFIPKKSDRGMMLDKLSPFQERILEAFVVLFEQFPEAACDRFGNYTAQKMFDRVAPSRELTLRVIQTKFPTGPQLHLGGNCVNMIVALKNHYGTIAAAAPAPDMNGEEHVEEIKAE